MKIDERILKHIENGEILLIPVKAIGGTIVLTCWMEKTANYLLQSAIFACLVQRLE